MPNSIPYELHNVLIIDDHPLVRHAVSDTLSQHFIECRQDVRIHEAGDGETAIRLAGKLSGCLALVDLGLPGIGGMELIKKLRVANRKMRILVLSVQDEEAFAERALQAGANGYLAKSVGRATLIEAIRCVCSGNVWLSENIKKILCSRAAKTESDQSSPMLSLSERELEIFEYIGQGLSRLKIKELTGLSDSTIETHRRRIKSKLGINGFSALNKAAYSYADGNPGGRHD